MEIHKRLLKDGTVHWGGGDKAVEEAATGLGLFLPPVGIGLYIACSFANLSADKTFRAMLPYTAVLAAGIVVLMMFPWLTLVVPRLVFG